MKENNNNKLLVIGNGFDLHLGVKSSLKSFFKSIEHDKSSIFYDLNDKEFDFVNDFINKISHKNEDSFNIKMSDALNDYIDGFNYTNFSPDVLDKLQRFNKYSNFWCLYFKYLKYFPSNMNHRVIYQKEYSSIAKMNDYINNWSDIEYQLSKLLNDNYNFFHYYVNHVTSSGRSINSNNITDSNEELDIDSPEDYFNELLITDSNGITRMTYIGALRLLIIYFAIACGWNPLNDNIYDFLYNELYEMENIFKKYLELQIDRDYYNKANDFALKLVNDEEQYNLINFNYTTFYRFFDGSKTNVHSTLKNGGHPIFGIGQFTKNNDVISNKPYYKFGKTYRIMKLATNDNVKRTLTSNINEIIFYGQSLSVADYSYFYTIFSHYDIYDNSKGIKLTFKYSERNPDNYETTLDKQIDIVYKLLNSYGEETHHYNLLHKLLMEKRIAFEIVPDDHVIKKFKEKIKLTDKWVKESQKTYVFANDSRYTFETVHGKNNPNDLFDIDSFLYSQTNRKLKDDITVIFKLENKVIYREFIKCLDDKNFYLALPTKRNLTDDLYYYYLQNGDWNSLINKSIFDNKNDVNLTNISNFKKDIVWYKNELERTCVENMVKKRLNSNSIKFNFSDEEISELTNDIYDDVHIKNPSKQNVMEVKQYAHHVIISHKLTEYINNNILPYVRKIREKDSE